MYNNMLKIIAGKFKGQNIAFPKSNLVRPTTNMVREAVFNMIQFDIHNSIVLDLFAGSGAYGIESISRGATKAIFNDKASISTTCIRNNLDKLKITNFDLYKMDFASLLKTKQGTEMNIIFLDPPYAKTEYYEKALSLIFAYKLLKSNGYIVIEKNSNIEFTIPKGLIITKEKIYGSKTILLVNNIK